MKEWMPHELLGDVEVKRIDDPHRVSLNAKRLLRARVKQPKTLRAWPQDYRRLASMWLTRSKTVSPRWQHLLNWAKADVTQAEAVLQSLLLHGWIEIEEIKSQQTRGVWQTVRVGWLFLDQLRAELGLVNPQSQRNEREAARIFQAEDERLIGLEVGLLDVAAQSVILRRELVDGLVQWLKEERVGTRRNFSLAVRPSTKEISKSEWRWLGEYVDLNACGIYEHKSLIYLGGNAEFCRADQTLFHLGKIDGYLAITVEMMHSLDAIKGVNVIKVIENLTSFENQLAQAQTGELFIWLPGYAAQWWLDAFASIVRLAGSEVLIACDCDPWGIELAMRTARVVMAQNKRWVPWYMDDMVLRTCKKRLPLTEIDRRKLAALLLNSELPDALQKLAHAQLELSAKAEQEQYL